jgi:uroporphyrinogen-III synthase
MGVLITRPEAAAAETARLVAARGLVPVLAPVLAVQALPARLPPVAGLQAVLLTSANALPALGPAYRALPLLAVGDATAARARAAGFAQVCSAGRNAEALAALVSRRCAPARGALLLPSARGEGVELTRMLRDSGFTVQRRAVYAAVPQKTLSAAAAEALSRGDVGAALFFSSASARGFTKLLLAALPARCLNTVDALALSPAVAAPLASLPWRRLRVAEQPTQDALLTLLADTIDE